MTCLLPCSGKLYTKAHIIWRRQYYMEQHGPEEHRVKKGKKPKIGNARHERRLYPLSRTEQTIRNYQVFLKNCE